MPELDYDNIELFTGKEVEHTPAYGMQTLFVNGKPSVDKILEHAVEHVYMGANHLDIDYKNAEELAYFNSTISSFCLLYTSPSPRDGLLSRMPSSA